MNGSGGSAAPRGRVLLIDDDRVFGLWATKVLEARGFEIMHVLDPVTGLRQVEAENWDLVITDVEMPRMTGLEFLERARSLDPSLPVAVVTAHPTVDRAVSTLRHAATEFIQKPITPEDFAAKVTALTTQRRTAVTRQESVLAIGAHPGDAEIGAGGALLAHQAAGVAVTVLTLAAAGDRGPGGPAAAIGTRVGIEDLVGDAEGEANPASAAIGRLIAQIQPTVLYTHSVHDSQPEHRNTHLAAMAAARRVGRVYCFQSPSATLEFRPGQVVPIDEHIAGKLRAVRAFAAQPEVRDYLAPDLVTTTARYWSRYCEANHAEAFEVIRERAAAGVTRRVEGQAQQVL
jgi:two-component system response regulator HydG